MNNFPIFSNNTIEVISLKRAVIVLLFVIAIIIIYLLVRSPQKGIESPSEPVSSNILYNSTSNAPSSQENSGIIAMASKIDVYTVKEYEGHIGVFHNDDTVPYQEIDVDVASLPEADQTLLKDGIKVYSTEKLNSIIEDYES
jgi:hypothetical protein